MVKIIEHKSRYIKTVSYEKSKEVLSISAKNQNAFRFLSLLLDQMSSISGIEDNRDIKFTYNCNKDKRSITFRKDIKQALSFLLHQEAISKETYDDLSNAIKCEPSEFFSKQCELKKVNPLNNACKSSNRM